jgi:hypothetical protein
MKKSKFSVHDILLPSDYCSEFLKERLFGLSNPEGNHGESIKEVHYHLDNVPTVRTTCPIFL